MLRAYWARRGAPLAGRIRPPRLGTCETTPCPSPSTRPPPPRSPRAGCGWRCRPGGRRGRRAPGSRPTPAGSTTPCPSDEFLAELRGDLPLQRSVGVFDDSIAEPAMPVATVTSWPAALTVPGGEVVAWAISGVTVAPTHRRRGIARAMLESELRVAVERRGPARDPHRLRGDDLHALRVRPGGLVDRLRDRRPPRGLDRSGGARPRCSSWAGTAPSRPPATLLEEARRATIGDVADRRPPLRAPVRRRLRRRRSSASAASPGTTTRTACTRGLLVYRMIEDPQDFAGFTAEVAAARRHDRRRVPGAVAAPADARPRRDGHGVAAHGRRAAALAGPRPAADPHDRAAGAPLGPGARPGRGARRPLLRRRGDGSGCASPTRSATRTARSRSRATPTAARSSSRGSRRRVRCWRCRSTRSARSTSAAPPPSRWPPPAGCASAPPATRCSPTASSARRAPPALTTWF